MSHIIWIYPFHLLEAFPMQDNLSTKQSGPAMAPAEDCEAWLQPIPESQRTHKVSGQFWIWAGANLSTINWVFGAL